MKCVFGVHPVLNASEDMQPRLNWGELPIPHGAYYTNEMDSVGQTQCSMQWRMDMCCEVLVDGQIIS